MKDQIPASVSPKPERWMAMATCCVGAIVGLGCASDGDSQASIDAIVGGWSNEAEHRILCIARDRRMWLGDSSTELDGPNPCSVDDTGTRFECSPPDAESAFEGSIEASSNQLALDIAPCPTDAADCHATYVRDVSLTCE